MKNELQESKNKNNQFSKDLENLKKETEEKNIQYNKEIERIKSENDKNFQELQSLYNSKRFKIVNKIANIVKPNKNF